MNKGKTIIILGALVMLAMVSGISSASTEMQTYGHSPAAFFPSGTLANGTGNNTSLPDPQWSEINMNLSAEDPSLQLDITAQPGVVSPMLSKFSVTLRAPGNSSYYILDSALQGGSHVLRQGIFSWNTTFTLQGTSSGTANFTFFITSGKLQHTSHFTYFFQFMSPVNYINYEHAKLAPLGSLTYTQGAQIGAGAIVLGIGLYRLFLPVMRKKIQKDSKKEGMILLAAN
jgi:hypothetical protein